MEFLYAVYIWYMLISAVFIFCADLFFSALLLHLIKKMFIKASIECIAAFSVILKQNKCNEMQTN